jgi:hypothetical protein
LPGCLVAELPAREQIRAAAQTELMKFPLAYRPNCDPVTSNH